MQLLADDLLRLEALDRQVRLGGNRLHPPQQIGRIFFFGQHGAERCKPGFELRHFLLEFGQLLGGVESPVDVFPQHDKLLLPGRDFDAGRHVVVVDEGADAGDCQHGKCPDLSVPRKLRETEIHDSALMGPIGPFLVRLYTNCLRLHASAHPFG